MGMIKWIMGLARTRWVPFALIGIGLVAAAVFGAGYFEGYNKAEEQYQAEMNKALKDQYDKMLAQSERERKIAIKLQRGMYDIWKNVDAVQAPTSGCQLSPDGVQWYDDVLRASSSDSE